MMSTPSCLAVSTGTRAAPNLKTGSMECVETENGQIEDQIKSKGGGSDYPESLIRAGDPARSKKKFFSTRAPTQSFWSENLFEAAIATMIVAGRDG